MRLVFGMLVAGLAIGGSAPARAQISGDVVKIGGLTDMSGIVSDATGEGSVVAAQLAAARDLTIPLAESTCPLVKH